MPELELIGAAGTIAGIIAAYLGYQKGLKKDIKSDGYHNGSNDAQLKTDIEYIKRRTDDVLLEQKDTNKSISALTERVTRVEESSKQAHKRIDRLEKVDTEIQ